VSHGSKGVKGMPIILLKGKKKKDVTPADESEKNPIL